VRTKQPEVEGTYEECLRRALVLVLGCCTVVVLPGRMRSDGARLEVRIADCLGMPVLDAATMQPAHRDEVSLRPVALRVPPGSRITIDLTEENDLR
jgi:hypothetical protein